MPKPCGFLCYAAKFVGRFAREATPWARDNIVLAAGMLVVPLFVGYLLDRSHRIDLGSSKITFALYGVVFLVYLAFHLAMTPWRLDQDRQAELVVAHSRLVQLTEEADRLRREAEERKPRLSLEVLEVLFCKEEYPRDVFLKIRLSNLHPNTICTVVDYELTVAIGAARYCSHGLQHDLHNYQIVNEPADSADDIREDALDTDLASQITHKEPIRYGAPREGWLHFHFSEISPMVPEFSPVSEMRLKIIDPLNQTVEERFLAQYSRNRYVSRPSPVVRWV